MPTSGLEDILYHLLNFPFIPEISWLRFFRAKNQPNRKPYSTEKITIQDDIYFNGLFCFDKNRLTSILLTAVLFGCHFSITEVCFTLLLGLLPPLLLLHFPGCFLSPHFNLFHMCPFPCLFSPVLHVFHVLLFIL